MLVEKYGWAIQKILYTNQDPTFSHNRENSKMFNITLKYFSFFNNEPPASWVAHVTRDFLPCYSWIKSFLINDEYQHKSTRINTSQHESIRVQHELTRINTSPARVNTSPTHESTRINTSPTRINKSPTWINTSPTWLKRSQQESVRP